MDGYRRGPLLIHNTKGDELSSNGGRKTSLLVVVLW